MHSITRYEVDDAHGWYVDEGEVVLDARYPETWPGTFEAFLRLRGESDDAELAFQSALDRDEFLDDVGIRPGSGQVLLEEGGRTSG